MDDILKNINIKIDNALYVVATPIGNLLDITIRALHILNSVDTIICEDTRISNILLNKFKITNKKLFIYNDHSNFNSRNKILKILIEGKSIALISDAGTPLISDPGYKLINFLRENNQKIIAIPGSSALTASISISGIACDNFLFLGFLPQKFKAKKDLLTNISSNYSFIFFESAKRLLESLQIIADIDNTRKICIAKELTKVHEEIFVGNSLELITLLNENIDKIRGEIVVLVEKKSKDFEINYNDIDNEIIKLLSKNKTLKEICEEILSIFDVNKKDLYQRIINLKKQ